MPPPTKKPSLSEPVTETRRVPIRECGEPLVDFLAACPALIFAEPRFNYTREHIARAQVARALCEAASRLPSGFRLSVVEGWRPPHIQRRMYLSAWNRWKLRRPEWSDAQLRRTVNRFTAPIGNPRVPPPHSTGGAVDVMLVREDGTFPAMSAPYEMFDPAAFAFAAPGLSDEALAHRAILAEALAPTVLTNYPSEFWHWSFGDQGWAYRGGHEAAIYGPIQPPGWTPRAEDDVDEPLVFVDR